MTKTVVGLFGNYQEADAVVRDLRNGGFAPENISIIANQKPAAEGSDTEEAESLGSGVGTGAAIGGIAGLILGLGALAIPGIGPIIAAGPIAAALTGAGIGAAAGGLLGTLSHMGVPEDEANFYAEGIRRGGALVAVHAREQQVQVALDILNQHHATDVDERDDDSSAVDETVVQTRTGDSIPEDSSVPRAPGRVYGPEQSAGGTTGTTSHEYEQFEPDFRAHHATTFYDHSPNFDEYAPAYRLGHRLATERRYSGSDFGVIEPEARSEYERDNPGQAWDDMKDAVRHAFNKVRQPGER